MAARRLGVRLGTQASSDTVPWFESIQSVECSWVRLLSEGSSEPVNPWTVNIRASEDISQHPMVTVTLHYKADAASRHVSEMRDA